MTIFAMVVLVWSVFLGRYFLLNEWGMDFAIFAGARLGVFLQFIALVGCCLALGLRFQKWMAPSLLGIIRFVLGMGLGLGALSLYTFFCGIMGFLNMLMVFVFLGISLLLGFKEGISLTKNLINLFRDSLKSFDTVTILMALPLIWAVMSYGVGTASPIIDYDALEYHVGLPAYFLKVGKIVSMSNHVYSHFSMNTEMLYLVSLLLGRIEFIKLFNFLFILLSAGLVYGVARDFAGRKAGLLSAMIFLCSGHLAITSWMGKSDIAHAFYCLASVASFIILKQDRSSLILTGIFSGLALGSKSLALFYCFGAFVLTWLLLARRKSKVLMDLLLYLGVSVLIASPWWIKNFLETGDPIFPMGPSWFRSSLWTPVQYAQWWAYHTRSLKEVLSPLFSYVGMSQALGVYFPTALVGFPLGLFSWRERKIRFLIVYTILGYLFVLFGTVGDPRFLLPVFPVLAVIVGVSFLNASPILKRITGWAMILFVFWNLGGLAISLEALKAPSLFWGVQSHEQVLREMLPPYPAFEFLNQTVKKGEQVLFLGEARTFYVEPDVLAPTVFDHPATVPYFRDAKDGREVLLRLKKDGVNYLLVNPTEIERWNRSVPGWDREVDGLALKNFIRDFGELRYHDPKTGIQIYSLHEKH